MRIYSLIEKIIPALESKVNMHSEVLSSDERISKIVGEMLRCAENSEDVEALERVWGAAVLIESDLEEDPLREVASRICSLVQAKLKKSLPNHEFLFPDEIKKCHAGLLEWQYEVYKSSTDNGLIFPINIKELALYLATIASNTSILPIQDLSALVEKILREVFSCLKNGASPDFSFLDLASPFAVKFLFSTIHYLGLDDFQRKHLEPFNEKFPAIRLEKAPWSILSLKLEKSLKGLNFSHFPNLQELDLGECRGITQEEIDTIPISVRVLNLVGSSGFNLSRLRNLQELKWLENHPSEQLKTVSASLKKLVAPESLSQFDFSCFPNLQELDLRLCLDIRGANTHPSTITQKEILTISTSIRALILPIAKIPDLNLSHLMGLQKIDFSSYQYLTQEVVNTIPISVIALKLRGFQAQNRRFHHLKLQELDILQCSNLTQVSIDLNLDSIKVLRLKESSLKGANLSLFTSLQELDLTLCQDITQEVVNTIPVSVRILKLKNCDITNLSFSHLTNLQELDLASCKGGLTQEVVNTIQASVKVLNLEGSDVSDLNLSHLKNLREVYLKWFTFTESQFAQLPRKCLVFGASRSLEAPDNNLGAEVIREIKNSLPKTALNLLKNNALISTKHRGEAVKAAAEGRHLEIIRALLENNAYILPIDRARAIRFAAKSGYSEIASELFKDLPLPLAFQIALAIDLKEKIQELLSEDTAFSTKDRGLIIILASQGNYLEIIDQLLKKNAEILISHRIKAVKSAIQLQYPEAAEKLFKNLSLSLTLQLAAGSGLLDKIQKLTSDNHPISIEDRGLAVIAAAQSGELNMLNYLLDGSETISEIDRGKAVIAAIEENTSNNFSLFESVLSKLLEGNLLEEDLYRATELALKNYEVLAIHKLLDAGATLSIHKWILALKIANKQSYSQIDSLLSKFPPQFVEPSLDYFCEGLALKLAAALGKLLVVQDFLRLNPSLLANDRIHALNLAAANGHLLVVRELLKDNPKVSTKDLDLALDLAKENLREDVTCELENHKQSQILPAPKAAQNNSLQLDQDTDVIKALKDSSLNRALALLKKNAQLSIEDRGKAIKLAVNLYKNPILTYLPEYLALQKFAIENLGPNSTNVADIHEKQKKITIELIYLILNHSTTLLADDLSQIVIAAARDGFLLIIEPLIDGNEAISTQDRGKALIAAAEGGHLSVINYLLDGRETISESDRGKAVIAAIEKNTSKTFALLQKILSKLLKGNLLEEDLVRATELVLQNQDFFGVHKLLQAGAMLSIDNWILILKSSESSSDPQIDILLGTFPTKFVKRALRNLQPALALKLAAATGFVEHVQELLKVNSQISPKDRYLAFRTAATNGHLPVVQELLKSDSPFSENDLFTLLVLAAGNGHLPVVQELLKSDPPFSKTVLFDVLVSAAANGHLPVVQEFIRLASPISIHNRAFLVSEATQGGHLHVVHALLKDNAQISSEARGQIALRAAELGNQEVFEVLNNGEISSDNLGKALLIGAMDGNLSIVQLLKNNPTISQKDRDLALKEAKAHFRKAIVRELES